MIYIYDIYMIIYIYMITTFSVLETISMKNMSAKLLLVEGG